MVFRRGGASLQNPSQLLERTLGKGTRNQRSNTRKKTIGTAIDMARVAAQPNRPWRRMN